jgi:hypothetical protein
LVLLATDSQIVAVSNIGHFPVRHLFDSFLLFLRTTSWTLGF